MKKTKYLLILVGILLLSVASCGTDDDQDTPDPPRDRGDEALVDQRIIEEYLQTHFYNYEAFDAPPTDFDYKIVFDTIAGTNANKTPLIDQVSFKMVQDRIEEDVMYKLYYLIEREGSGETPDFTDIVFATYEGTFLDGDNFDGAPNPVRFDLTQVVNGFQDVMIEFNGAGQIIDNPDGTVSYDDFGIGAMFIPSGLGYFDGIRAGIPSYSELVFTFQLIETERGDQDNDGIPSILEDLNGNGLEEDDDTDGDNAANYADSDDDQDGRPTRDEIEIDANGVITYPDVDGDGTPDYLDSDS